MFSIIKYTSGRSWLMPVILATQEAEIRRTVVQRSQIRQIVPRHLVLKNPSQK
jgi:hypothetical protein